MSLQLTKCVEMAKYSQKQCNIRSAVVTNRMMSSGKMHSRHFVANPGVTNRFVTLLIPPVGDRRFVTLYNKIPDCFVTTSAIFSEFMEWTRLGGAGGSTI